MLQAIKELLSNGPPGYPWVCAYLGLVVGSFLNVVIHRLPVMLEHEWTGEAPAEPYNLMNPSRCPSCGRRLFALELVPIISYLVLRGRCRSCHAKISPRYLVVEFLTGVLFLFAA